MFSSSYVRAVATSKYFTDNDINIIESFGERKFGFNCWEEKPNRFEEKQYEDFNYKYKNGESLNEVIDRELKSINYILNNYSNKKILIVGHSTAFSALFSRWCEVRYNSPFKFNDKVFFDGKWNYCEAFKLVFNDDNDLVDIINIK